MSDQQNPTNLLGNRYRLEHILGRGGMSIVYKAYDVTLERPVAVKVLRQDYSDNPEFQKSFHQEAKAAANLTHPNIVTIHDFGFDHGKLFIVMEYIPGTDLKQLIRQKSTFEVDEALDLLIQACEGIGYAHRAGIVHCDVKPLNMLVTPDLRLKVTDFGIARVLSTINIDEKSDLVWGSPQYFSPEQASGKAPLPASDVYSLGVILYEMLTGKLPFKAESASEYARMHREQLPQSPTQLNPAIPLELEKIILKTLAKEPAARYRTADQLSHILGTFGQATNVMQLEDEITIVEPVQNLSYPQPPAITHLNDYPTAQESERKTPSNIDWVTWMMGIAAFLLVGGLIPFWMNVILKLSLAK